MDVLVIGSGGREHAIAWKLTQSKRVSKLFVAPGNGGTQQIATNVPIQPHSFKELINFAKTHKIGLTVVGPDDALALGIVDAFKKAKLKVFGPTKAAAKIESSKAFAKKLMLSQGIHTAKFKTFTSYAKAFSYIKTSKFPLVIKADGLALGKGVSICLSLEEANRELKKIMVDSVFGKAGKRVVIEEFLQGQEISCHALTDGRTFKLLPTAQDHKAVFDGDNGPNTGGMGTIAPVSWVSETLTKEITKVASKTLKGMQGKFAGCLFPGLIITPEGPKVLEFNARFGDPETQSFIRILKTDLLDILEACATKKLYSLKIETYDQFACCIILASGGYPGKYKKGLLIKGLAEASKQQDIIIFHAGTTFNGTDYFTNGGRVLGVTAVGETLEEALKKAYKAVNKISFPGMHYRKDIGKKCLEGHS